MFILNFKTSYHCNFNRIFNTRQKRYYSDLARVATTSENFFSEKNRQRIVERLEKNFKSPPVVGEKTRSVGGNPKLKENDNLREAAVLVPLVDVDGIASILFTVRSNHLSVHRGEVSFPGGSADKIDGGSAVKTALRETHEEIGVDPKNIDVWGHLPPTLSRNGESIIKPVLGVIKGGFDMSEFSQHQRGNTEVWTVFTRDLDTLSNRDHISFTQFRAGYSLPVFSSGAFRIWGLTAIILHNTLKILLPDSYRPVIRYVRPVI